MLNLGEQALGQHLVYAEIDALIKQIAVSEPQAEHLRLFAALV